jgi:hypothetical protein
MPEMDEDTLNQVFLMVDMWLRTHPSDPKDKLNLVDAALDIASAIHRLASILERKEHDHANDL